MHIPPFPASERQFSGHCGPTSLALCLGILGIDADQRKVRERTGQSVQKVTAAGTTELDLRRAARRFGVQAVFVERAVRAEGDRFLRRIDRHLNQGLPLILEVADATHWVAVVGRIEDQYIVFDPDAPGCLFRRWSRRTMLARSWNDNPAVEEQPRYFAILFLRRDGSQARWLVTDDFIRLAERGSVERAEQMLYDLIVMVGRATGDDAVMYRQLADVLAEMEERIVAPVRDWVDLTQARRGAKEVRALYRDYLKVARAAGLTAPVRLDQTCLAGQMVAVLTTYAWTGTL